MVNVYEFIALSLIPYLLLADGELLLIRCLTAGQYFILVEVLVLLDVSQGFDGFLFAVLGHLLLTNR